MSERLFLVCLLSILLTSGCGDQDGKHTSKVTKTSQWCESAWQRTLAIQRIRIEREQDADIKIKFQASLTLLERLKKRYVDRCQQLDEKSLLKFKQVLLSEEKRLQTNH